MSHCPHHYDPSTYGVSTPPCCCEALATTPAAPVPLSSGAPVPLSSGAPVPLSSGAPALRPRRCLCCAPVRAELRADGLRRCPKGSLYQRAVAIEQARRSEALRDEIEARKRALAARQREVRVLSSRWPRRGQTMARRTEQTAQMAQMAQTATGDLREHRAAPHRTTAAALPHRNVSAEEPRHCQSQSHCHSHSHCPCHCHCHCYCCCYCHCYCYCCCHCVCKPRLGMGGAAPCRTAHAADIAAAAAQTHSARAQAIEGDADREKNEKKKEKEKEKERMGSPMAADAVRSAHSLSLPPHCRRSNADFGRKIYITDDAHHTRRTEVIRRLEEDGFVRQLTPTTRSPSAPLPSKSLKWETTRSTSAHKVV